MAFASHQARRTAGIYVPNFVCTPQASLQSARGSVHHHSAPPACLYISLTRLQPQSVRKMRDIQDPPPPARLVCLPVSSRLLSIKAFRATSSKTKRLRLPPPSRALDSRHPRALGSLTFSSPAGKSGWLDLSLTHTHTSLPLLLIPVPVLLFLVALQPPCGRPGPLRPPPRPSRGGRLPLPPPPSTPGRRQRPRSRRLRRAFRAVVRALALPPG